MYHIITWVITYAFVISLKWLHQIFCIDFKKRWCVADSLTSLLELPINACNMAKSRQQSVGSKDNLSCMGFSNISGEIAVIGYEISRHILYSLQGISSRWYTKNMPSALRQAQTQMMYLKHLSCSTLFSYWIEFSVRQMTHVPPNPG